MFKLSAMEYFILSLFALVAVACGSAQAADVSPVPAATQTHRPSLTLLSQQVPVTSAKDLLESNCGVHKDIQPAVSPDEYRMLAAISVLYPEKLEPLCVAYHARKRI